MAGALASAASAATAPAAASASMPVTLPASASIGHGRSPQRLDRCGCEASNFWW
jgi:hypothetical protein